MAITTFANYLIRQKTARRESFYKQGGSSSARLSSTWAAVPAGTIPSTSTVCTKATIGALNYEAQPGEAGLNWCVGRAAVNCTSATGSLIICDRLVHQGGLSGIVIGAQTTNLPTTALTRYTSGEGVFAALEIYGAVGTTATVARMSYTNQAGIAGQTTYDVVFGTTSHNAVGRFIIMPLADGDTGVRSVESVTLDVSTGTAGSFGVTLFKPLTFLHPAMPAVEAYGTNIYNALIGGGGQMEQIVPQACLFALHASPAANTFTASIAFLDIT